MGDVKKYEGDRQVSFIDAKAAAWLAAVLNDAADSGTPTDGLCLERFRADITAEGVSSWKAGDEVELTVPEGGVKKYRIAITGKRCFPECGLLQRTGVKCPLADGVAFGKPYEK